MEVGEAGLHSGRLTFRELPAGLQDRIPWDGIALTRTANIVDDEDLAVVGEYGEGKRIFFATRQHSGVNNHYCRDPQVKHIHSILRISKTQLLIATGDSAKYLDLWKMEDGRVRFHSRIKRRLAGYTGAVTVGDEHYFGTDFSSRPNFLLRLRDNRKFFLPKEVYLQYVVRLQQYRDRYIVGSTKRLDPFGGCRGVFVFDCAEESFLAPM